MQCVPEPMKSYSDLDSLKEDLRNMDVEGGKHWRVLSLRYFAKTRRAANIMRPKLFSGEQTHYRRCHSKCSEFVLQAQQ